MSNKKNLLDQNKDEVKAWWNSKDIKKWASKVYDPNSPSYHHLEERRIRTLNFFKSIKTLYSVTIRYIYSVVI